MQAAQSKLMSSAVARSESSQKSQKGSSKRDRSSRSKAGDSVSQSQTSDMVSGTEMSQTGTNQMSSEVGGAYGKIKAKVEYVDDELPDSMLTAIKIIERLLTQTKYHKQHVAYKNYPPMNLEEKDEEDEEDEQ